jgi:hypothetical protein
MSDGSRMLQAQERKLALDRRMLTRQDFYIQVADKRPKLATAPASRSSKSVPICRRSTGGATELGSLIPSYGQSSG